MFSYVYVLLCLWFVVFMIWFENLVSSKTLTGVAGSFCVILRIVSHMMYAYALG